MCDLRVSLGVVESFCVGVCVFFVGRVFAHVEVSGWACKRVMW